jgi:hypothetical protein
VPTSTILEKDKTKFYFAKIIYELAIPSSGRVIALLEHYGSWLTNS